MANRSSKQVQKSCPEDAFVNDDTTCHIDQLPNEILQKIFEKLIKLENHEDSNGKSNLTRNNQSYLNCRLVSSHWKSGMEQELEKNALSIWKKLMRPISIRGLEAEPFNVGYLYVLKTENRLNPVEWVFLPPPLDSWEGIGNPFPSRSLVLTPDLEDRNSYAKSTRPLFLLMELTPFFSKFGGHLTSLILKAVTLNPETLIGILGSTPELKALTLIKVLFCGDVDNCAQLPALQKLQHIRDFQVDIVKLKKGGVRWTDFCRDRHKIHNWILSPYKEQLKTLDIYGQGGIETAGNFAKLERLFISHVDHPDFLKPNLFLYPQLKSLFLTEIQIRFEDDRMEWLRRHIAPFAETLSELHLDYPRGHSRLQTGPLYQLSKKSVLEKTSKVVFPEMKRLAIPFPKFSEEKQVIEDLIKGFPNLEKLTFLIRGWEYHVAKENTRRIVDREEYGKVCPKLEKVMYRWL